MQLVVGSEVAADTSRSQNASPVTESQNKLGITNSEMGRSKKGYEKTIHYKGRNYLVSYQNTKYLVLSILFATLCCALIIFVYFFGLQNGNLNNGSYQSSFKASRASHKFKSLRMDRMESAAQMSDMDYFWRHLLRPMLIPRVSDTEGNRIVQEHIKNHMAGYGWTVEDDMFQDETPYGTKNFNNIIATFDPSVSRRLVLACHYDSKYYRDFEFIGATDSAVPCAMMLDLARVMNSTLWRGSPTMKDVTLQFIFFDGEEAFKHWTDTDSIYGARHLAAKWAGTNVLVDRETTVPEIEQIDVLILLDLIGAKNPVFSNWFRDTSNLFERMQKIETRLAKEGLLEPAIEFRSRRSNKYFVGKLQSYGGIQDDHIPFLNRDVPVLHMIAYPFPDVWHKKSDNEAALDRTTIDNLNKIMRVFVAEYLHLSP